jgi:membrane protein implicated in regulation of membrane protease activity
MADSTVWWLLAGGAVALELITGTFFLLMLAFGMAAGALAAHLGLGLPAQLVAASVVGGGAIVFWHRWRQTRVGTTTARFNRDVNLDIGQNVTVTTWEPDGTARIRYRGAEWTVQLQSGHQTQTAGAYQIVAVEGSRLLVRPLNP